MSSPPAGGGPRSEKRQFEHEPASEHEPEFLRHDAPALFRRYPALAARIPWVALGSGPTPVEPLPAGLAPPGTEAWIKRDDLTGVPYGGNKVRKLEFLLAAAREAGARRLITAGAAGSHHALATTIHGRRLGFQVSLVLFPQPLTRHVRQILLMDRAFGADLRYTPRMELVPATVWALRWIHRDEEPYVIAPGGSDAVGTLGYVSAALELADQVAAGAAPQPDVVHVAAGTLGTAAGLALGFALAGLDARIVATRITSRLVTNERRLLKVADGAARVLQRAGGPAVDPADALGRIELHHDQIGEGYGRETAAGRSAAARFAARGLALDPTYTAKAAAGLLAALAERTTGVHLFWHTLSAAEPVEAAARVRTGELPAAFRRYLEAGDSDPGGARRPAPEPAR